MSQYSVFSNAPIVESVLDIQFEQSDGMCLEKIETFHNSIKDRFPNVEKKATSKAHIKISEQGPAIDGSSIDWVGFRYDSPSDKKIIQAKLDGFSFNKLKPYENWEVFSSEARELWERYSEIIQPIRIKRIALRYINRIDIPLPVNDFKEYILTIPEIAHSLPQGLSNFFMRLEIPKPDINAMAIINEVMDQMTVPQILPIIFDIDVFKLVNYNEHNEMWKDFDQLRIFKNDIFFESMTDKAKGLFK